MNWKRNIIYAFLALFLLYLSSTLFFPLFTKHTSFCGLCHTTREAYRSWKISPHSKVNCLGCHGEGGFGGGIATGLRGLRNFSRFVFNSGISSEVYLSNDACLSCHDRILDDLIKKRKKNIKMSHREVVDAGWRCPECHSSVGHRLKSTTAKFKNASMDKCFACHQRKKQKKWCLTCHLREPLGVPKRLKASGILAHGTEWPSRHGALSISLCQGCHRKQFCQECHFITLPHNNVWPEEHGEKALTFSQACPQCHLQKFCFSCHQTEVPHKNAALHGQESTETGEELCLRCHYNSDCQRCHVLHQKHK